jgi:heme-degrading monooxygenase HmoA
MGWLRGSIQEGDITAGECEGPQEPVARARPGRSGRGYSITLWESEADMRAFWDSKEREEAMALLRPFFLNQFTITQCEVRSAQH